MCVICDVCGNLKEDCECDPDMDHQDIQRMMDEEDNNNPWVHDSDMGDR